MKINVLITGGSGFIGSHLTKACSLEKDIFVYAISRTDTKQDTEKVKYLKVDLAEEDFTNKLPDGIDCVIHLAQSQHYRDFPLRSEEIFNINARATLKLLNWGIAQKIKKFVYFSSGNVYEPQDKLLKETDQVGPGSFYGSSKLIAEELCKNYSQFFEVTIFRAFGIYGPGQKGMFIQNLFNKLINGQPIYLASGIGMKITPLFISDCIEIVLKVVQNSSKERAFIYNLCGNEVLTIKEIVDEMAAIRNISPNYISEDKKPMFLMGQNKKIISELGFSQKVSFKEGIKQCIVAL